MNCKCIVDVWVDRWGFLGNFRQFVAVVLLHRVLPPTSPPRSCHELQALRIGSGETPARDSGIPTLFTPGASPAGWELLTILSTTTHQPRT
jgi:hypothetical protein